MVVLTIDVVINVVVDVVVVRWNTVGLGDTVGVLKIDVVVDVVDDLLKWIAKEAANPATKKNKRVIIPIHFFFEIFLNGILLLEFRIYIWYLSLYSS